MTADLQTFLARPAADIPDRDLVLSRTLLGVAFPSVGPGEGEVLRWAGERMAPAVRELVDQSEAVGRDLQRAEQETQAAQCREWAVRLRQWEAELEERESQSREREETMCGLLAMGVRVEPDAETALHYADALDDASLDEREVQVNRLMALTASVGAVVVVLLAAVWLRHWVPIWAAGWTR